MKWLFLLPLLLALWVTRPGAAIDNCERVNTAQQCEILNAE